MHLALLERKQLRRHRASTCPPASLARNAFSAQPVPRSPTAATVPFTGPRQTASCCRHFKTFRDAESYYAILAHETTHWTHAAIVDLSLTKVVDGDLCCVYSWYDNEFGYANTLVEHVVQAATLVA